MFTGAGSPVNKVIGLGFDDPVPESAWDNVERLFSERQCAVRVEISTLADPAVAAGLTRRGYVLAEFENVLGFDPRAPAAPSDQTAKGCRSCATRAISRRG